MYLVRNYVTPAGVDVFARWLKGLPDREAKARCLARLARLPGGNFGDCRAVGNGVWELRIDHGPGYRVYYALEGREIVLLLCGGDKRRQRRDIRTAVALWTEYQSREGEP